MDRGGNASAGEGAWADHAHSGEALMAEAEDHRAWRPPSVAETLRAPASPFALDTERRAALSLVLMNGFALGQIGSSGVGICTGPGNSDLDTSLRKNFKIPQNFMSPRLCL